MIRKLVVRQCIVVWMAMFIVSCATPVPPAPPKYILYKSVKIETGVSTMRSADIEGKFPSLAECEKERQKKQAYEKLSLANDSGIKYNCISDAIWSLGPPPH